MRSENFIRLLKSSDESILWQISKASTVNLSHPNDRFYCLRLFCSVARDKNQGRSFVSISHYARSKIWLWDKRNLLSCLLAASPLNLKNIFVSRSLSTLLDLFRNNFSFNRIVSHRPLEPLYTPTALLFDNKRFFFFFLPLASIAAWKVFRRFLSLCPVTVMLDWKLHNLFLLTVFNFIFAFQRRQKLK